MANQPQPLVGTREVVRMGGDAGVMEALQREQAYLRQRLAELMTEHAGEWVVVKDEHVVGFYKDMETAFGDAIRQFGLDNPFLLQQVQPEQTGEVPALATGLMYAHL